MPTIALGTLAKILIAVRNTENDSPKQLFDHRSVWNNVVGKVVGAVRYIC